jgi:DNA-binding transcriptional ArsR family regulator
LKDSRKVLPPSDAIVLGALADRERLDILRRLMDKPLKQAEIRRASDMRSGTASKQLGVLEACRLIARDRSHGPYVVASPTETARLLRAAADLAAALSRQQATADEEHARALRGTSVREHVDNNQTQT